MLAAITETDEQGPEGVDQAPAFRPETIFASCLTATRDKKGMTGNVNTQSGAAGPLVEHHETVVGMPQFPGELFIMLRTEPGRVFTFGFCGVFTALTAGPLFDRLSKKIILCAGIDVLPETD